MHLEDCPHKMNAAVPQFLGHIPIYEEGALISAVLRKNVAGNFRQDFSQKVHGGHTFIVMGIKRFPITSQALFLSDLEGVVHSRFLLYNHLMYPNIHGTWWYYLCG